MQGHGDVLNVYVMGGSIWGTAKGVSSAPPIQLARVQLRDKLLDAMRAHCRPNKLDVLDLDSDDLTDPDRETLAMRIDQGVTVENIVLHGLSTLIKTGVYLLTRQLGQEKGRVIILVASPHLLGSRDDPQGEHAARIVIHVLSEIYGLSPGVYVSDGSGFAPIPVEQAQLLNGSLVVKS